MSPWAPGAVGNLSRQTSAAPQPRASVDLPQPFSYMRRSRSRGLFPLRLAGKWAHRDEGLPACSALGGQHVCVRSSSLCVSNNTEPCSLENPAKAAAVPQRSRSRWFRAQGVSGASSSGSGWKREGLRGREGPHTVSRTLCHGPRPCGACRHSWGEGVRGAAGRSCGVSVSTSLGVRVCCPPSQRFCVLKTPALPAGQRSRQGPRWPCAAVTRAEGWGAPSALS